MGLKEAFRAIYRAAERRQAEERLERFLAACDRAALAPFTASRRGFAAGGRSFLAYFDQPATNGYAEGVINKIR